MKYLQNEDFTLDLEADLPLLKCSAIPVPHGFSTRIGGVSRGDGLDSLDLGMGEQSCVSENRRRFALSLGGSDKAIFSAKQIHSDKVETVSYDDLGKNFECDAFVTNEPGLLLTVKVADCVPILLYDKSGIIGAVHAGWRGTASGVVKEAVKAMCRLGARPENMIAAVGQSIKKCCYEVDPPFVLAVREAKYGEELLSCITPSDQREERYYADLPEMNRILMLSSGLTDKNIHIFPLCTSCHSDIFFSHRASKGKRGLMMAGIMLDGAK